MVRDFDRDIGAAPASGRIPAKPTGLGADETDPDREAARAQESQQAVCDAQPQRGEPIQPSQATGSAVSTRFTLLLAALACLGLLLSNVFWREQFFGDEGFYGVTALNMLRSSGYVLRPSFRPDGDFLADKDGFAHPPFNSYLYALSLWPGNARSFSQANPPPPVALAGPEIVNAVAFALLLYFVFQFLRTFDPKAATFTVLLLIASPAMRNYYSQLEAEPLMTTAGIAGLYYAVRSGPGAAKLWFVFASGLCLGLAFAFKLWLCGPLGLAIAAALVLRVREASNPIRNTLCALPVFGIAFLLPAGVHLAAIGLCYPQDLQFWLKNIYFGVFTHAGISGSKVAGVGVASEWVHPIWYYGPALYRDHFFLLPILLLGVAALFWEVQQKTGPIDRIPESYSKGRTTQLVWILFAGFSGILPLSVIKVKEPLYVLSCSVFLYCLAGLCLAALVRRFSSAKHMGPGWLEKAGLIAIIAAAAIIPALYALHIQQGKITGAFVMAHSGVAALVLVLFWMASRRHAGVLFERGMGISCIAVMIGSFAFNWLTTRPQDRAITQLISPVVGSNSPTELSFIASNYKSQQYSTFRSGCYWRELDLERTPAVLLSTPQYAHVRAFILDADDLENAGTAPWLAWLQSHAMEKTDELNAKPGKTSGLRVFVR
jgi:hypothetical protein